MLAHQLARAGAITGVDRGMDGGMFAEHPGQTCGVPLDRDAVEPHPGMTHRLNQVVNECLNFR